MYINLKFIHFIERDIKSPISLSSIILLSLSLLSTFRPYKKSCFPSSRASLLDSASKQYFSFILLNMMLLALRNQIFGIVVYFEKDQFSEIVVYDRKFLFCKENYTLPRLKGFTRTLHRTKNKIIIARAHHCSNFCDRKRNFFMALV